MARRQDKLVTSEIFVKPVTISNGSTTSNSIQLGKYVLAAVRTPSAVDGTLLTFEAAAEEGGTFLPIHYGGAEVSMDLAASQHVEMDSNAFKGVEEIRIVSDINETAKRKFELVLRCL